MAEAESQCGNSWAFPRSRRSFRVLRQFSVQGLQKDHVRVQYLTCIATADISALRTRLLPKKSLEIRSPPLKFEPPPRLYSPSPLETAGKLDRAGANPEIPSARNFPILAGFCARDRARTDLTGSQAFPSISLLSAAGAKWALERPPNYTCMHVSE